MGKKDTWHKKYILYSLFCVSVNNQMKTESERVRMRESE